MNDPDQSNSGEPAVLPKWLWSLTCRAVMEEYEGHRMRDQISKTYKCGLRPSVSLCKQQSCNYSAVSIHEGDELSAVLFRW